MADIYDTHDVLVEEYNRKLEKLTTTEEKQKLYEEYIQKLLDYEEK